MGTPPSVLFVAHGSPQFALEPGAAGAALSQTAHSLVRPRALLVISPHWETQRPSVGSASQLDGHRLPTIHDFGGFDPALYAIQYPACGNPQAADTVVEALHNAGLEGSIDPQRGLDHGAWVPLAIQHHGGPEHAHRVGQALAPLAEQGWLIVASGNITHNLRDWQLASAGAAIDTSYAQRFADWIAEQLREGNREALLDYRQSHSDARRPGPGPCTAASATM
jgi:4,5-DOPA dioxygenase extradiol